MSQQLRNMTDIFVGEQGERRIEFSMIMDESPRELAAFEYALRSYALLNNYTISIETNIRDNCYLIKWKRN